MGVVTGDSKGINIRVPKTGDTAAKFEGIALNSFTQQHDLDGVVSVSAGAAVSVMRYGRAWGRIPKSVTPEFGDALYLIISGDDAGKFTNAAGDGTTVALKAVSAAARVPARLRLLNCTTRRRAKGGISHEKESEESAL